MRNGYVDLKRGRYLLGVALAGSLLLTACGGSSAPSANAGGGGAADGAGRTLALSIPFGSAPFYWAAANGFKDEGERLGYKVVISNADNSAEKQVASLDSYRVQKVAGVAVIAIDADALDLTLNKLTSGGTPVFAIDRDVHANVSGLLVTDNVAAGRKMGEYTKTAMNGRPIKALVIYGPLNVIPFVDRFNGFLSAFAGDSNFQLVGSPDGGVDPAKALTVTKTYLQAHPDINAIFSVTDVMASGIVTALKESNRAAPAGDPGHVVVTSVDGSGETLTQIRNGTVDATFSQYPYIIGVQTVRSLDLYLNKRSDIVPGTLYFGGDAVSKKNISTFKNLWGDKTFRTDLAG